MIITCPSCKKKFNIDISLIPSDGRDLQCGSCEHIWFYKKDDLTVETYQVNDEISVEKNVNSNQLKNNKIDKQEEKQSVTFDKKNKPKSSEIKEPKSISVVNKKSQSSKLFSYLIVFIISFGALIVLLDTLKTPLINIFPGLEVLLFNLYETLKDIKLFIIDLS